MLLLCFSYAFFLFFFFFAYEMTPAHRRSVSGFVFPTCYMLHENNLQAVISLLNLKTKQTPDHCKTGLHENKPISALPVSAKPSMSDGR